ncbi:Replication initiation factor [Vibrio mediterranei]|uniref:Replication initiation factor family protein n=1 Tax=Vibrio mediterranei TaxID=689 RepID=A0A3G4V574_9VIBR|nr:replication initiation factor domain-containing protein [Vibrio mediterranei]AYV19832.1 replication initiation factor family protein [Vibrio mediterranei]AYV19840.1 replication initiation factor family protein [Vibrio mediterranei]SBO13085.1 Replication initiation factor [Vibrio mediterranei]
MKKKVFTADELQIDTESSPFVFVDYLSWTIQYSALRHAHKSDLGSLIWAPLPKPDYRLARTPKQKEKLIERYKQRWNVAMMERLEVFCLHVLGLRMSSWREKGLYGYEDSCHLMPKHSNKHVGFVLLGGNRGTCHFQIEGLGCKSVLEHTTLFRLHWWLNLLGCSRLSRIDLAVDDFHGLFGREYARKAFAEDAFRTSERGRGPSGGERYFADPSGKVLNESFTVGDRSSRIHWRIYNKAAQLGLDMYWFRNEVELKEMPIDILLNIKGYFAGLCAYSASIIASLPVKVVNKKKQVALEIHERIRWARRQVGRTLFDIAKHFDGDLEKVFGLLISKEINDGHLTIPDTYKKILYEIMET